MINLEKIKQGKCFEPRPYSFFTVTKKMLIPFIQKQFYISFVIQSKFLTQTDCPVRHGALFTCLSSRAVHIEVSHNVTTDSFIMCLRRFIGHRGYI